MKDIPVFDTETGVSTLVLKEIPYKQIAYIKVQSVQPGGLAEHLRECVSFCRMCGAERVFATGHPELERWPLHCSVLKLSRSTAEGLPADSLFPVTEETVSRWRDIYNEKMGRVDNAATMTAQDEKQIVSSGGAYFVHDGGSLLGIGWVRENEILCIAAVRSGAGERVLGALLTLTGEEPAVLEVASTNDRALRLYERMGFVTVAERSRWHMVHPDVSLT